MEVKDLPTVGVIGAGKMGGALIRGIQGATRDIWAAVRSEQSAAKARDQLQVPVYSSYTEHLARTDILLLCVKPNAIAELCSDIHASGRLRAQTIVVSVAAGVTTKSIEGRLDSSAVIRAMPNTACQIRKGMTVLCRGTSATDFQIAQTRLLFDTVGECIELPEASMSAATAVGASGLAFVYLVIEAMRDGGIKAGLSREAATTLAVQSIIGAGEMTSQTGQHPASLRDEVSTPGGCTIAGLLILEDGAVRSRFARAIEEAARVASGLGNRPVDSGPR